MMVLGLKGYPLFCGVMCGGVFEDGGYVDAACWVCQGTFFVGHDAHSTHYYHYNLLIGIVMLTCTTHTFNRFKLT